MSFFPGQGQQHGYPPQQPYYGGPPPQNYGGPPPQGYGGPPPQGYPPQNGYPYVLWTILQRLRLTKCQTPRIPASRISTAARIWWTPSATSKTSEPRLPGTEFSTMKNRNIADLSQKHPPTAGHGYGPPPPGGPMYAGRPGIQNNCLEGRQLLTYN